MLPRHTACLGLLVVLFASGLGAVELEEYFIGLSTELGASAGPFRDPGLAENLRVDHVSFVATYGPGSMRPLRLRSGLGWFPDRPFRVTAGLELPLFESLNRYNARMFGVYLLTDLGFTIPWDWEADAALTVLFPVSTIGGIRFGVGLTRRFDMLFSVGYATGLYPIRIRR